MKAVVKFVKMWWVQELRDKETGLEAGWFIALTIGSGFFLSAVTFFGIYDLIGLIL